MNWDLVEVKALPNWTLAVRFSDGVEGAIQLDPETLTGVLTPLRSPDFFAQVFIEEGAPAWPGNIDIAPDALYAQIRARSQATAPDR